MIALCTFLSAACTGGGTAGSDSPNLGPDPQSPDCDPALTLPPGDHEYTIASANGVKYRYTLVMPTTVVPGKRAPLAIVWHGLGSTPEETRGLTHIDATMAKYAAISVHPRSPDKSWDAGTCCTSFGGGPKRDETIFVRELLADIKSRVCIDSRRIYTTGFSNGGMLSQVLSCKMPDVFAASAPMSSSLTIAGSECNPSRPVPQFMINGTGDQLVHYSIPNLAGMTVPSSFQLWANRDGCTGSATVTLSQGKASCQTYRQCAAGSEVTLCTVEGMGHCMPGMRTESATNCLTKNFVPLGMPNNDIDGIDLSAEFLIRFSLP